MNEQEIPRECLLIEEPLSPEKVEQMTKLLERCQDGPIRFSYIQLASIAPVSKVRRLLHGLGIHYWTRWSAPGLYDTCYIVQYIAQERACYICNKVERRKLDD